MSAEPVAEEDRVRPAPGEPSLWFASLGAAVVWAVHFMAVYLLLEVACRAGWQQRQLLGLNGAAAAVLIAGLLALPMVIASGLVARRVLAASAQQLGQQRGEDERVEAAVDRDDDTEAYPRHLGLAGLVLAGIFFLAIVAETVPALVLGPCPPGA